MDTFRAQMEKENVTHLVLTNLDDVAYLLNVRGSDIQFNPVFFAYAALSLNSVSITYLDALTSDRASSTNARYF